MKKLLFVFLILGVAATQSLAQNYADKVRQDRQDYFEKLKDKVDFGPGDQVSKYLKYYDPDTSFIIKARFEIKEKAKKTEMITSSGDRKSFVVFGELHFTVEAKKCVLQVYRSAILTPLTRNLLFVPFKDLTSGNDTYGAGRYLDFKMEEIKGDELLVDFNKAYNPLCAYETGFSCPVPPKENHLKVRIEAGEKNFKE